MIIILMSFFHTAPGYRIEIASLIFHASVLGTTLWKLTSGSCADYIFDLELLESTYLREHIFIPYLWHNLNQALLRSIIFICIKGMITIWISLLSLIIDINVFKYIRKRIIIVLWLHELPILITDMDFINNCARCVIILFIEIMCF